MTLPSCSRSGSVTTCSPPLVSVGAPTSSPFGEMLFIMVLFHISPYKDFKHFQLYGISHQYRHCFGQLPSYSRFVRLMPRLLLPLYMLLRHCSGNAMGWFFGFKLHLLINHKGQLMALWAWSTPGTVLRSMHWSIFSIAWQLTPWHNRSSALPIAAPFPQVMPDLIQNWG